MKQNLIYISLLLIGTVACRKEPITSVWVPKEPVSSMPAMGNMAMPGTMPTESNPMQAMDNSLPIESDENHSHMKWKIPSGWTEQPASAMRVGSFLAKGTNGQAVDISVVSLSGEAGGLLANVNRWRGQINLSPIDDAQLSKETKTISPSGRKMTYVNILSTELMIDNRFKKRLVAAIYEKAGQTWFFKMTGEESAVTQNEAAFKTFLTNLTIN